jgi:hypothetical protein
VKARILKAAAPEVMARTAVIVLVTCMIAVGFLGARLGEVSVFELASEGEAYLKLFNQN